jgi:integrase
MAEDPLCLHVLSTGANDHGTKDCSSARRNLLSRSTRLVHSSSPRNRPIKARPCNLYLAIDSKLRACDLVKLRSDDVGSGVKVRHGATIVQKKTARPVQFEITEQSRSSVEARLPMLRATGFRYLFPSRLHAALYGTHSMRRTKAARIYRETGNLRAVQLLLGHTKLESKVRYLGIEVEDASNMAEQIDL